MIKNSRNVCHGFVSFFHFTGMKFGGLWGEEKEKLRKGSANDSSCKTCSCFCRRTLRFWFTSDCSPYFELSVWAGNNIPAYGLNYHKDILLHKSKNIYLYQILQRCALVLTEILISLRKTSAARLKQKGCGYFHETQYTLKTKIKCTGVEFCSDVRGLIGIN